MINNKSKSTDRTSKKIATAASVVAAVATIGAGGYGLGVATSDGLRDAPDNYTITQQEYQSLTKSLSSLKTRAANEVIPEYNRDSLPTDWRDPDGNGCNTRYDVIVANFRKYARYNNENCEIKSGTIFDYYNDRLLKYDKRVDSGGGIQIDHMVSIGNAWLSGGYNWDDSEWVAYINDEEVLIPTASSTNREKSDKDITEWKPTNTDFLCAYAVKQINIKKKYNLMVTIEEKDEFKSILKNSCVVEQSEL